MTLGALLDLVVPRTCIACSRGEQLLCASCRAALALLRPPVCGRCGASTAWPVERCAECAGRRLPFRTARAAVAYDGPARELVRLWKDNGLRRLGREAALLVEEVVPRPRGRVLAYVPGDGDRTAWRGVNTAEALARELAAIWQLPVADALRRRGRSRRQRGLPRGARRANVRGAFEALAPAPRQVVLVDDVYTTGATVAAAATELRRAGARSVDVVTFARAVRRAA